MARPLVMSRAPGQIDFGQVAEVGPETDIGPGLPSSNQTPCALVAATAAQEPGTAGSWGWAAAAGMARGPVGSLKLDQGGHKTVRCLAGGGQMLLNASTVISEIAWIWFLCQAACFCREQFMVEFCVYRELLGCPLKCLNNIVSTRCRLICILATVSSSRWAKNPNGNQTIWSLRA